MTDFQACTIDTIPRGIVSMLVQTTTLKLLHLSRVLATFAGVVYLRLKAEER